METISTEVVEDKSLRETRGRRIMGAQRREELLERYRAGGMTQKAFAKHEGVNFHTLCAWLAKHRQGRGAGMRPAPVARADSAFVEMRAPAAHASAPMRSRWLRWCGCWRAEAMLALGAQTKIYLAVEPADMRKHFDSLWALAGRTLRADPRQGALFVFSNKARNRLKILYWDGSGVCILAKRLERGRFNWPRGTDPARA